MSSDYKNMMEFMKQLVNADASIHIDKKDGCVKAEIKGKTANLLVLIEDVIVRITHEAAQGDVGRQLSLLESFHNNCMREVLEKGIKKELAE